MTNKDLSSKEWLLAMIDQILDGEYTTDEMKSILEQQKDYIVSLIIEDELLHDNS